MTKRFFEDSVRLLTGVKEPFFFHLSTNQMHQPGYVPPQGCPHYKIPAGVDLPPMTVAMIQSAHCTDFYLQRFLEALRPRMSDTIVYVTADHSTNIPLQVGMDDDISRIPLLFFSSGRTAQAARDCRHARSRCDLRFCTFHCGFARAGLKPKIGWE